MAKLPANWSAQDGSSTINLNNAGVQRIEQNGTTVRVEQDGVTIRVLNDVVVVPKSDNVWDSL